MKRVGIVGEHYDNDAGALKKLLEQQYDNQQVIFFPLLKTLRGKQLDNVSKVVKMLVSEAKKLKLNFIIYMHDLDSLPSDNEKFTSLLKWYYKVKLNDNDLFFISIFELEALMLADIDMFNELYAVNITFKSNPLFKENPKEFLKLQTAKARQKYHESHSIKIFENLRFSEIYNTHCHPDHPCFQSFIDELNEKLA